MNLVDLAAQIWARKWRSLLLAVVSAAIAVLFTYSVSLSPAALHPRALRFGVARTDLLLDSGRSTLADSTASLTTALLAGDIAEVTDSNFVIDAVARRLHVAPSEIGIQQQFVQNLPRLEYYSQEAQVGTQILSSQHRYQILVRNDQGTFVIQLFTQAPTGAEAIAMANATSQALSSHVASLVRTEHIPASRQVILRQLAPATGGLVDPSGTRDAAVLIGLISWIMLMIAAFAIDRMRALRRSRRAPTSKPAPSPDPRSDPS